MTGCLSEGLDHDQEGDLVRDQLTDWLDNQMWVCGYKTVLMFKLRFPSKHQVFQSPNFDPAPVPYFFTWMDNIIVSPWKYLTFLSSWLFSVSRWSSISESHTDAVDHRLSRWVTLPGCLCRDLKSNPEIAASGQKWEIFNCFLEHFEDRNKVFQYFSSCHTQLCRHAHSSFARLFAKLGIQ